MKKLLFVSVAILLFSVKSFAQKETGYFIGVTGAQELRVGMTSILQNSFYGLEIENKFSKNWGFQTGILHKRNFELQSTAAIRTTTIPIMMKFYSKVLNISLGVQTNFFPRIIDNGTLPSELTFNKYDIAPMITVGQDFYIANNIYIEPELRASITGFMEDPYIGLGIKLKYLLGR